MLFGEDASRVVLSCDPIHLPRIQQVAEEYGVVADVLGETGSDRVEITVDGQSVISASVTELREAYEGALERALRTEPGSVRCGLRLPGDGWTAMRVQCNYELRAEAEC